MENYYDILQVDRNASEEEIKKAYARLLRKHNPEKDPENFKKIREAYETLSNKERRANYDFMLDYGQEFMDTLKKVDEDISQKRYEEAEKKLKKLLSIKQDSIDLWIKLSEVSALKGNRRQAIDILSKALNAVGESSIVYHLIGLNYSLMNDFYNAEKYLKKALVIEKNFYTFRELYFTYFLSGRVVEAEQVLRKISELEFDDLSYVDYKLLIIRHHILMSVTFEEAKNKVSWHVDELIRLGKQKEELIGYIVSGALEDIELYRSLQIDAGLFGMYYSSKIIYELTGDPNVKKAFEEFDEFFGKVKNIEQQIIQLEKEINSSFNITECENKVSWRVNELINTGKKNALLKNYIVNRLVEILPLYARNNPLPQDFFVLYYVSKIIYELTGDQKTKKTYEDLKQYFFGGKIGNGQYQSPPTYTGTSGGCLIPLFLFGIFILALLLF